MYMLRYLSEQSHTHTHTLRGGSVHAADRQSKLKYNEILTPNQC